jgi:hypothetical protein
MFATDTLMRDSAREAAIIWALRLGFALVGVIAVYVLAFGT